MFRKGGGQAIAHTQLQPAVRSEATVQLSALLLQKRAPACRVDRPMKLLVGIVIVVAIAGFG